MNGERTRLTGGDWAVVAMALGLPTVVTWLYFIALDGAEPVFQQGAYTIGKTLQFLLPVIWVCGVRRERPKWSWPRPAPLVVGAAFGAAVAAAMLILYFAVLEPLGLFTTAAVAVREKVRSFGAGSPIAFVLLAIFYSALHSLLEEYYWRWFAFGELARGWPLPAAVLVSSLAFAAHHVLVLAHYFGWAAPLTWLFTLAVAVGGAVFAVLYRASGSLAAPWLSHALVDAAIFAIGYSIVAG